MVNEKMFTVAGEPTVVTEVRRRVLDEFSDLEFYDRTSENTIENIALRSDIEQALSKLNNIDRQIVLLSIIGGYKSHEIGNLLYLNATTVRSKLNRSLAKVRQYLGGV